VINAEVGAFVLEPPESGVLTRYRFRIMWVDLDDVAEPMRLCCVIRLGGVKSRLDGLPAVDARLVLQPVAAAAERS
jgi:hypothetical protein